MIIAAMDQQTLGLEHTRVSSLTLLDFKCYKAQLVLHCRA